MPLIYTLFIIVFLEGYVVLSVELLAIRQMLPFIGSGTDTTAILISAVLVPLAFGYYTGGHYKTWGKNKSTRIRKRLLRNLALSAIFLLISLSHIFIFTMYHYVFIELGIRSFVTMTVMYGALFIAPPIYLLGQTVPLISNYLPKQKLSKATGKILFFSTLGSFAGAIFSTLVLMAYLGVHYTISITIGCILVLSLILVKKHPNIPVFVIAFTFLISLFLNSGAMMQTFGIVQNNQYNMIQIEDLKYEDQTIRAMRISQPNTYSSALAYDETVGAKRSIFPYIRYVDDNFINTDTSLPKRDILVIGSGGFTVGYHDKHNNYVFVDIDKDLLETSEKYFLKEKLSSNKIFVPKPARAFLATTKQQFDLIFVDIAKGPSVAPDHLTTKEFYQQLKDTLKPDGIIVMNQLVYPNFSDINSVVVDNTIRSVFKNIIRAPMYGYDAWGEHNHIQNVMYTYFNKASPTTRIYTDNLNRQMYDKGTKPHR